MTPENPTGCHTVYICVCNAITDTQIREAARSGVRDLWALQAELGVATNCGSCREAAAAILGNERRAEPCLYVPAVA